MFDYTSVKNADQFSEAISNIPTAAMNGIMSASRNYHFSCGDRPRQTALHETRFILCGSDHVEVSTEFLANKKVNCRGLWTGRNASCRVIMSTEYRTVGRNTAEFLNAAADLKLEYAEAETMEGIDMCKGMEKYTLRMDFLDIPADDRQRYVSMI